MLPVRHGRPMLQSRPTSLFPDRPKKIEFWHPGTDELILSLPANDVAEPNVFGLHHGTALLACRVLAYNAQGYLSTSPDPTDISFRHTGDPDSLLFEPKYYYIVTSTLQYEICQQFSDWRFPHDWYEEVWGLHSPGAGAPWDMNTQVASFYVKQRDSVCVISGDNDSLTMAHLVPILERAWVRVLIVNLAIYDELSCTS